MTRTRRIPLRIPLVGSVFVLAGALTVAQQPPASAPRDPPRELTMSVADGFTLAAVGDWRRQRSAARSSSGCSACRSRSARASRSNKELA